MTMQRDFAAFKARKIKASDIFNLEEITKPTAYEFVRKYHYLGDVKFFCVRAFGLFYKETLVGCAVFSLPQGTETLKSWFSLGNDTKNIYELSRLCVLPDLNGSNATSFLLSGSIKKMKKENTMIKHRLKNKMQDKDWSCRAVITLANSQRHVGSIYQVCNFHYYGLTKKGGRDFFSVESQGKIAPRGKLSETQGVYLIRPQKHRYAIILDSSLKCNYNEMERPSKDEIIESKCCNGTKRVFDKRFGVWYTCPRCTKELKILKVENEASNGE